MGIYCLTMNSKPYDSAQKSQRADKAHCDETSVAQGISQPKQKTAPTVVKQNKTFHVLGARFDFQRGVDGGERD